MDDNTFVEKLLNDYPLQSDRVQSELDKLNENVLNPDDGVSFVEDLLQTYSSNTPRVSKELRNLKRKLQSCENHTDNTKRSRRTEIRCEKCDKSFLEIKYLNRHKQIHEKLKCKFCKVLCSRTDSLKKHIAEKHNQSNASVRQFACKYYDLVFPNYDGLIHHMSTNHPLVTKQTGGGKPSKKKVSRKTTQD